MLPFPVIPIPGPEKAVEYKQGRKLLTYRGKVACINQIANRNLLEPERTKSLHTLYNLFIQNGNTPEYSREQVIIKNNSLTIPLPDKEVDNLFRKVYNYKCSSIRERLPYVTCEGCEHKFPGGKFKMRNIILNNFNKLPELSSTESKVILLLGTYFEGEIPLQSEMIRVSKLSRSSVKKAMESLKEKGAY
jgi:hypothetical protein